MELPVWSAGVAITILSPIVEAMASRGGFDIYYLAAYNLVVWVLIGAYYLFYKLVNRE